MKVYIFLWKDRHADTTALPFLDLEKAKAWARMQADKYCKFREDLKEEKIGRWLFYIRYSCESDCLWITEHTV